ncbi:MAG: hypothetical protein U9N62_04895 [Thermotogota bacterium]|nr:hypothetical protein [Thermotogota bacterium]
MSPKQKYDRAIILKSALKILRLKGNQALTARNIAHEMGCSTHPIYSEFESLKGLKKALFKHAYDFFIETVTSEDSPKCFLDVGVNYVRFSKNEKNLFSFVFMNKDFKMDMNSFDFVDEKMIKIIKNDEYVQKYAVKSYNTIFYNLWIFTHGLATLMWESELDYSEERVKEILKNTGEIIIRGLTNKK